MKRIFMHDSELIATVKGPVRLERGSTVEVEDWIAASILGRGLGHEVDVEMPVKDYDEMTLAELRAEGQALGVADFKTMRKAELLAAIKSVRVVAEPPPPPFEHKPASGGKSGPEAKR